MSLTYLRSLKSFTIIGNEISDEIEVLSENLSDQQYLSVQGPIGEEHLIDNFGFFVDKIKSGTDIPIVIGYSLDNSVAKFIENNFQQTIELTGIVSFRSDPMFVTNRIGTFSISDKCAVILNLRDFQRTCIYIAGRSPTAKLIGMQGLLNIFDGPFFDIVSTYNAVVVSADIINHLINVSPTCSRHGIKIENLKVAPLALLNSNM